MDRKVKTLLEGKGENHIAPFFWQHGESEAVLRKYMEVIEESGCGAVCVESRFHPDFCGPKWWEDMDVILDEARKRSMKVWILDDSHFPTGYANGALEKADPGLCRQSVFSNRVEEKAENGAISFCVDDYVRPPELKLSQLAQIAARMSPRPRQFDDDRLISVTAVRAGTAQITDLTEKIDNGRISWKIPEGEEGEWSVYVNGLSRNCGPHRNYINMMDRASCRVLIDSVYEPHFAHYGADFGETIAGFFSDEPELGNGILYMQNNPIGTKQDLPWSREVEEELTRQWGDRWRKYLPLLWDTGADRQEAAKMRYLYMDTVTRLVKKDFSEQIGGWCRAHGVEYIGHVIEDEGQHCRTASSLGHYFRGLSAQDMAGIDDIGAQVFPGGEDGPDTGPMGRTRNGEFYHYGLAALAASAAAEEPEKKGRAMCEIFGNYGWKEGVKLEKYLADHFLVRGINFFVPHAFSPKEYPDPDCPPHFYAHGNNPQYRHFGKLIRYMNRVCSLFDGGRRIVTAAVLYHGESEWCGQCMPFEKVMRKLNDRQICADVLPADVFEDMQRYRTRIGEVLQVNTQEYRVLIIPEAEFIPESAVCAVRRLQENGFPVLFVNRIPGCCQGTVSLEPEVCMSVELEELADELARMEMTDIQIEPADNRVRVMHYEGDHHMFMLVNEGEKPWKGKVSFPVSGPCYIYDAMENRLERGEADEPAEIVPGKSRIYVFDEAPKELLHDPVYPEGKKTELAKWRRSQCRSVDYPSFTGEKTVILPDHMAQEQPEFSGYVRYETTVCLEDAPAAAVLEITELWEGAEVFVNGVSAGLQITSPMIYDLTEYLRPGENRIAVEAATTLERERAVGVTDIFEKAMMEEPCSGSGITGQVFLWIKQPWQDRTLPPEKRAQDLLARMSPEEKLGQIQCYSAIHTGGRPLEEIFPHGVGEVSCLTAVMCPDKGSVAEMVRGLQRRIMEAGEHHIPAVFHIETLCGVLMPEAVSFPSGIGQAAAWNPELSRQAGEIIGRQARAAGFSQALSPVLDISRDPRFGRQGESCGEDPVLASVLGTACVRGLQNTGDFGETVAATAKHFLAFQAGEGGICTARSAVPERELLEVYAKPFQAAISEGNLRSIMNSYSSVNGEPVCGSKRLLTGLLRDRMGFGGFTVSDYCSVSQMHSVHHVCADEADAGRKALEAGIDCELPTDECYTEALLEQIQSGKLDVSVLDRAVLRVLTEKFRLGLFEHPYPVDESTLKEVFCDSKSREVSRRMAAESLVLLKNNGILPMDAGKKKIALIGCHADSARALFGGYSFIAMKENTLGVRMTMAGIETEDNGGAPDVSERNEYPGSSVVREDPRTDSLVRACCPGIKSLREALETACPDAQIRYAYGYPYAGDDETGFPEALRTAEEADIVILTLGGRYGWNVSSTMGEGIDAMDIGIPKCQEEFIRKAAGLGKPVIGIHFDGRPISSNAADIYLDALLEAWTPGEYGAEAIADILVGRENPGGKLPVCAARGSGQIPVYYAHENGSGFDTGKSAAFDDYVDGSRKPLYFFGHGLSYTTFRVSAPRVDRTAVKPGDVLHIETDVENTGDLAGSEVVQLYVKDCFASVSRPVMELAGFCKVYLKPGGKKTVTFEMRVDQTAFLDETMRWKVEAGEMKLMTAVSSDHICGETAFAITEDAYIDGAKRGFWAEPHISGQICGSGV